MCFTGRHVMLMNSQVRSKELFLCLRQLLTEKKSFDDAGGEGLRRKIIRELQRSCFVPGPVASRILALEDHLQLFD